MKIYQKFEPFLFLSVYLISSYALCWSLSVWQAATNGSFQTELQALVILPVIYSAYKYYPRIIHLIMLVAAAYFCIHFRLEMGHNFGNSVRAVITFALIAFMAVEMLHYAIGSRMRMEHSFKNLRKVHELLVEEKNKYKDSVEECKRLKTELEQAYVHIDSLKLQLEMKNINNVISD